jgi:hypothetical protein
VAQLKQQVAAMEANAHKLEAQAAAAEKKASTLEAQLVKVSGVCYCCIPVSCKLDVCVLSSVSAAMLDNWQVRVPSKPLVLQRLLRCIAVLPSEQK